MGQIILTHSNSGIFHHDPVACPTGHLCLLFFQLHRYSSAIRRVLDGIADNIENNLSELRSVSDDIVMSDLHLTVIGEVLLLNGRFKNNSERIHQFCKASYFFF